MGRSQPYDLAAIYERPFDDYPPYLIYLRVLWELYGRQLEEEQGNEPIIQLTTFQTDGLWRAPHPQRLFMAWNICRWGRPGKTFADRGTYSGGSSRTMGGAVLLIARPRCAMACGIVSRANINLYRVPLL